MKTTTLQGLAMAALAIGWTLLTIGAYALAFILAVAGVEPAMTREAPPARAGRMARNPLPIEVIDSGDAVVLRSPTVLVSAEPLLSPVVRPAALSQPHARSRRQRA